jgi:hypothetical protein
MKQWKVRIYQEGDETGIIDLMNLVFRQTKYDMEYTRERAMKFWSWKYKTAPRGFLTVVADDHGKLVGHIGKRARYQPDYIVIANPAYENEIRQVIRYFEMKTKFILI